jgi:hypothetical protein
MSRRKPPPIQWGVLPDGTPRDASASKSKRARLPLAAAKRARRGRPSYSGGIVPPLATGPVSGYVYDPTRGRKGLWSKRDRADDRESDKSAVEAEDRPWTQGFAMGPARIRHHGARRAAHRGWMRPGGGYTNYVQVAGEWQGTTVQVCGLWPFGVYPSYPAIGIPSGVHERTGEPICGDPLSWFEGGIITSPSAAIFGLNGLGKSSLSDRWVIGWCDQGVIPINASDVKGEHTLIFKAVEGETAVLGDGHKSLNVLDISFSLAAAKRLEEETADPAEGRRLAKRIIAAAVDARNTVLYGLVSINRGTGNAQTTGILDWEKALIDQATLVLDERFEPGEAVLEDLIAVIEDGTDELRAQVAESTDPAEYAAFVKPFVRSLKALTAGSLGATFGGRTTVKLDVTRPLSIDISSIGKSNTTLKAAVMLACWAKVILDVETLHVLADGGLERRRKFAILFEELWNVIGAAGGMVFRLDELSRLNRTMGTAVVYLFHSLVDFQKLATEEERAAANGLVERCGMLCIFGVPTKELAAISEVVELTDGERKRLTSWKAEAPVDPETGKAGLPAGLGRYIIKTSSRAGVPVSLRERLTAVEMRLHNTNERWEMR